MKSLIYLVLAATVIVAVQLAEIPWSDPAASNKYDVHYNTHKETVQTARKGVSERLQEFGASDDQFAVTNDVQSIGGGGAAVDPLCTISCVGGARIASSNSEVEQIDQSGVGVGYVGFNGQETINSEFAQSEHSQTQNNVGATIIPVGGGSNSRATYHQSSEHISESAGGGQYPIVGGGVAESAYDSSLNQVAQTKEAYIPQTHVFTYPVTVGAERRLERISSESSKATNTNPIHVTVYPSGGESQRYLSHSERNSESRISAPAQVVVLPVGGAESRYSGRLEKHSESRTNPSTPIVYNFPSSSGSQQRYASNVNRVSETTNNGPIAHYPIGGGSSTSELYGSRLDRFSERRPVQVPITYHPAPVRSSERYLNHQEHIHDSSVVAQPIIIPAPSRSHSSSSRYTNEESRTSSHSQQPQFVTYTSNPSSSASQYAASENYERTSNAGFGSTYGGNFDQNRNTFVHNAYGNRPSARIGSSRYSSGASADLSSYISESERLARLQSQQGGGRGSSIVGSGYGSSTSDHQHQLSSGAGFGSNAVSGGGGGGGNGAFIRTKSWENNEKWASGTEYDENGRPRTYSSLSTAESELHNVNGKSTGYKAATTTLEDDGKISTYSIHT